MLKRYVFSLLHRLAGLLRPGRGKAGNSLIIFKPDGIGDFLLATGAIKKIIDNTENPIVLLVDSKVAALARKQFPTIEVFGAEGAVKSKQYDSLRYLRDAYRFASSFSGSELICLRHALSQTDHIILKWLKPTRSVGILTSPISPFLPESVPYFRFSEVVVYPKVRDQFPFEVCAHREILNRYFSPPQPWTTSLLAPLVNRGKLKRRSGVLLVFPHTRQWQRNLPIERLAKVINQISPSLYSHVRVCGSPTEQSYLVSFLATLAPHTHARLAPTKSLDACIAEIESSAAVLSMDSAPAHFAIQKATPNVALLSGGQYGYFAPYGDSARHIWLNHQTECYHCNWQCPHSEPICLTRLKDEEITAAVTKILQITY